jgi:hypothetical protein
MKKLVVIYSVLSLAAFLTGLILGGVSFHDIGREDVPYALGLTVLFLFVQYLGLRCIRLLHEDIKEFSRKRGFAELIMLAVSWVTVSVVFPLTSLLYGILSAAVFPAVILSLLMIATMAAAVLVEDYLNEGRVYKFLFKRQP